jgi:acetone carboxylase alpha subunit
VKGEVYFTPKGFATSRPFEVGDLYLNYLRGGPGYGDPLERDPNLIEQDVNGDVVSPRFAESVYGAALRKQGAKWIVDVEQTGRKRQQMREHRKARGIPARQWIVQQRERLLGDQVRGVVRRTYRECMQLSPSWAKEFREFWSLPEDFAFSAGGKNDAD